MTYGTSINDDLGAGGLENVVVASTDASGATVLVGTGGIIPVGVPCELYGASPSATATVNTAAIQQALDLAHVAGGGHVTLMTPGVFLYNSGLTIGDNTKFTLGTATVLKVAPLTQLGASLTPVVSGGVITSVTVTASGGGSCYSGVPTIRQSGAGIRKARVRALLKYSCIDTVAVSAGGTGYTVGDVLTLTTTGTGGTVTVSTVSGGVVTAVTVTTTGKSYTTGVKSTSGGTGTGCTINITALFHGAVESVAIEEPGLGYSTAPTIEVITKPRVGTNYAVLTPVISGGKITSVTITNEGRDYRSPGNGTANIQLRVRGRAAASLTPVMSGGAIASVTVNNGGAGYITTGRPNGTMYNTVFLHVMGAGNSMQPMITNKDWDSGNSNITIDGGTWDYSNADVYTSLRDGLNHMGMTFTDVWGLTIRNAKIINASKYCIHIGDVVNGHVHDIHMNSTSDGFHSVGNCDGLRVERISGTAPEGLVVVMSIDYGQYATAEGRQEGYSVRDVHDMGSGASVALMPDYDFSNSRMYQFTGFVDGVDGWTQSACVGIQPTCYAGDALADCKDPIILRNISGYCAGGTTESVPGQVHIYGGRFRSLSIDGLVAKNPSAFSIYGFNTVTVDHLMVENYTNDCGWNVSGQSPIRVESNSIVTKLTMAASCRSVIVSAGINSHIAIAGSGTKDLTLGGYYEGGNRVIQWEVAATVAVCTLNTPTFKNVNGGVFARGNIRLIINGGVYDYNSAAARIFWLNTASGGDVCRVYGNGWSFPGTQPSKVIEIATGNTIHPYSLSLQLDTTAATTGSEAGAYCYDTSGTPGHAGRNSTAWAKF